MTERIAAPTRPGLLELCDDVPEFRTLVDALRKRWSPLRVSGLPTGARAFLLAAALARLGRPVLWVVEDIARADRLAADLAVWLPGLPVDVFPALEVLPYELVAASHEAGHRRIATLGAVAAGGARVVIAPVAALATRLPPPEAFHAARLRLQPGLVLPPGELARRLVTLGYERAESVEQPGQFAVRGGIVDLFPPGEPQPLRVDYFGDEIEQLRRFDPASQRSTAVADEVDVLPARELVLDEAARARAAAAARAELEAAMARLAGADPARARRLGERIGAHLAALEEGRPFGALEWYLPYAYPDAVLLPDWLGPDALCVVEEAPRLLEALRERARVGEEQAAGLLAEGLLLPGHAQAYATPEAVEAALARAQVLYVDALPRRVPGVEPRLELSVTARQVPLFHGQWQLAAEELQAWLGSRRRVVVAASSLDRARWLSETLAQAGTHLPLWTEPETPPPGRAAVMVLPVAEGFELDAAGLVVLSERELVGQTRRRRPAVSATGERAARIRDVLELDEGDYVVHAHHGIGRFLGVKAMEVQGVQRDYLVLEYAGGDRLYVPVEQIELVQRYVGGDGRAPRVSRLGGADWAKVKQRVRESVRQLASELVQLYAARERLPGFAFPPDGPWQQAFEAAFPYEETEDQLRAAAEIKADMERPRPMDRLLCGDVGFGKTEVAMRAAFKAVTAGKQVAVLVPTTVLAQQHYHTFRERFRGFPVTIGVLSRFRSPREQAATVDGLRRGAVDIVIGTHRLLQPDVAFKDLGLLIVDEEHRFGVADKERIKQLKQHVDVLTLTATPIPRTLHMALAGIRDMSVIETPPEDRFPVQTFVLEYSDALVRDAIRRELARGGQVFYVHNRVQSIERVRQRLAELVPEARVAVAHGQMDEGQLERIMLAFVQGDYDVLLCTTIIESGLDIANANTLIVEDADRLGLAQLYQLRGRVGRSNRLAYAYLTYRGDRLLTPDAEKRLQALKDFTDLGSGFKLALRDLEIRGAGNLLGAEQHGHIAAVGFDLYAQLLEDAVRELRGEPDAPRLRPTIELPWDAYIPDDYVGDPRRKVELYRRIDRAQTRQELAALREELTDRYGPPPPPVENLLILAATRQRAAEGGVVVLAQERGALRAEIVAAEPALLQAAGLGDPRRGRLLRVEPDGRAVVRVRLRTGSRDEVRRAVHELLTDLLRARRGARDGVPSA